MLVCDSPSASAVLEILTAAALVPITNNNCHHMVPQITFPPHPHDTHFELQQEILTVAKCIEQAPLCPIFRHLRE